MVAFPDVADGVDSWCVDSEMAHTGEACSGDEKSGAALTEVVSEIRPVSVGSTGKTEESESLKLHWVHLLALEYQSSKIALMIKIVQSVNSDHFFCEILIGVVEPL